MSTDTFKHAKRHFVNSGIEEKYLIPITPVGANSTLHQSVHGKAPGHFQNGKWSGLKGSILAEGLSERQIEHMDNWPTENVGVLGLKYPAIDSDAENELAASIVDYCVRRVFGDHFGLRLRGNSHRRLYAFMQDPDEPQVRTRHIAFKLPGNDAPQKVDIIGGGAQYVASGLHNNGKDYYEWSDQYPFDTDIEQISNADVDRFVETLRAEVERQDGEITKVSGGVSGTISAKDVAGLEPKLAFDDLLQALHKLPNTEETFGDRTNFVGVLAAIRAVMGRDSFDPDVRDAIEQWATEDEDWCPPHYFEKIWDSLETVRVSQYAIDKIFRAAGVSDHIGGYFPKDDKGKSEIRKAKNDIKADNADILREAAGRYVFGRASAAVNSAIPMRDRWNFMHDFSALKWWDGTAIESDPEFVRRIRDSKDSYRTGKVAEGLANFLRDLKKAYPLCFYSDITRTPIVPGGEIIQIEQLDGTFENYLNTRPTPAPQRHATSEDRHPQRSQKDVRLICDFVGKLFDIHAGYELDTLAYMAQTGKRPGAMLFMAGESGVGKSIWTSIQQALFDGRGAGLTAGIDGARFLSEQSRRFALAGVEGARIVPIREMPRNTKGPERAFMTAQLKTLVDPGPEGEYVIIEKKGKDVQRVPSFARYVISSNYPNAIEVEEGDRRIFFVQAGITREQAKELGPMYAELVAIHDNSERLAAFWNYLLKRDISKFNPAAAPPVSHAKAEQVAVNAPRPIGRHMLAAVRWLEHSGRKLFTTGELAELMTELSEREYANTSGTVDDRCKYVAKDPAFMAAIRTNLKSRIKIDVERLRTATMRFPATYLVSGGTSDASRYNRMRWDDLEYEVKQEQRRGVTKIHPFVNFSDPVDVDE